MASEKEHRLQVLDFLVAALNEHDRELTALGDSLKESIRLLNTERFVEKYDPTLGLSGANNVLKKMDEVVESLQTFNDRLCKLEKTSFELKASTKLPNSLTKTYGLLSEEEGMTIMEVAGLTGRSRSLECVRLNQLLVLGFVEKMKKGRKHYYTKKPLYEPVASAPDSKRIMILVMVSEQVSEDYEEPRQIQDLVSRNLSDLKNWRFERSVILPR